MSSCLSLDFFRSEKSLKHLTRRTDTIEVKAVTNGNVDAYRAAGVSFDENTDENVVSKRFVTEVLNKPYYTTVEKETRSVYRTTKEVDGYTELVFCTLHNSRRIHTALFYISSEYNPHYDIVMGREGIKQLYTKGGSKSTKRARHESRHTMKLDIR